MLWKSGIFFVLFLVGTIFGANVDTQVWNDSGVKPVVAQSDYCANANVPECEVDVPRDLLFVVDASNSIDESRFFNEMLNFVRDVYCAFDPTQVNRIGLILFARFVEVVIPLEEYTREEWEQEVNKVRDDPNSCCSCCTPTAEAFALAKREIELKSTAQQKIVFVITDGQPVQNSRGQNPYIPSLRGELGFWPWRTFSFARYRFDIVPNQAQQLKDIGARIFLVGVPNRELIPVRRDYFEGVPDPDLNPPNQQNPNVQCVERQDERSCAEMSIPPFPIVSTPVSANSFETTNWDMDALAESTISSLCELQPQDDTPAPTPSPNALPTLSPTVSPSPSPTPFPIELAPTEFLNHLDLYFLVDLSRSLRDYIDLCQNIDRQGAAEIVSSRRISACWNVQLQFIEKLSRETATRGSDPMMWRDDFGPNEESRGLQVTIYGFSCREQQTVPVIEIIAEKISSHEELMEVLLEAADKYVPFGGTCPGASIERTVSQIALSNLQLRPFKSVVTLTDGVFYDMPRPRRASLGFAHFGAASFAVGIAVPFDSHRFGLRRSQIILQGQQLRTIASNNDMVYNLGKDGFQILLSITEHMFDGLPEFFQNGPGYSQTLTPYCGYTSRICEVVHGEFCLWNKARQFCRKRAPFRNN